MEQIPDLKGARCIKCISRKAHFIIKFIKLICIDVTSVITWGTATAVKEKVI